MILFGITPLALLAALVVGYLLGSIPFGVIVTRAAGVGDVRNIGSGNIGATNVLRTGRRDLALITLVADAGKAMLATVIVRALYGEDAGALAGAAAFTGHLFPVWLGFKGGKGVATFFGVMLTINWEIGVIAACLWIFTAAVFRISSLAALTAAALTPLAMLALGQPPAFLVAAAFMGVLIYLRHDANIRRLLKGEEPRIGAKTAPAPAPASADVSAASGPADPAGRS
jgi:glycerol-3-phosphate acyltransferase PlsY